MRFLPPDSAPARGAAGLLAVAGAVMVLAAAPLALPLRAAETGTAAQAVPGSSIAPRSGEEEVSSRISPVDACNRAQGQRPAGAVVTTMHYERLGQPGERSFRCRVLWSTAREATPTGRPILFGPSL